MLLRRQKAIVFRAEVVVEGVAGDSGSPDKVGDRHRSVALLRHLARKRSDNSGPLMLGDELARERLPTRKWTRC
jgi:hypothetical protein